MRAAPPFLALPLLALAWLAGCGAPQSSVPTLDLPEIVLEGLDGREVALAGYRGKVLLIDFWATWCAPCEESIPHLAKLQDRYGERGFQVIGIALDVGGRKVVAPYAEGLAINYDVLLGDEDATRAFGGIPGIPTSFVVDREGQIVRRFVGVVDREDYAAIIEPLLQAGAAGS